MTDPRIAEMDYPLPVRKKGRTPCRVHFVEFHASTNFYVSNFLSLVLNQKTCNRRDGSRTTYRIYVAVEADAARV